jgi:hypothetical protein
MLDDGVATAEKEGVLLVLLASTAGWVGVVPAALVNEKGMTSTGLAAAPWTDGVLPSVRCERDKSQSLNTIVIERS